MRITTSILAALAIATGLPAFAKKLEHGPVVAAEVAAKVAARTLRVGAITHAVVHDGWLYVAGTDGVAAVTPDGQPQWVVRLPRADLRSLAVDAAGIAVVSQDVVAATPGLMAEFLSGELARLPDFTNTRVTLLDRKKRGAIVWSQPVPTTGRGAPPALSAARIAYSDGRQLLVLNRADGTAAGTGRTVTEVGDYIGGLAGLDAAVIKAMTRNAPLYKDGAFYSGFSAWLSKVDAGSGKTVSSASHHGLTAFQNIASGPLAIGDNMVFGIVAQPVGGAAIEIGAKPSIIIADANGKNVCDETVDDNKGGIGSLVVHGDHVFAATNFTLTMFDAECEDVWDVETAKKDGALAVSRYRGIRFFNNVGVRTGMGMCMVVDDRFVYLCSAEKSARPSELQMAGLFKVQASSGGRDVITVIDVAKGEYRTTLDPGGTIADLLEVGDKLAVVGFDEVRFVRKPQ